MHDVNSNPVFSVLVRVNLAPCPTPVEIPQTVPFYFVVPLAGIHPGQDPPALAASHAPRTPADGRPPALYLVLPVRTTATGDRQPVWGGIATDRLGYSILRDSGQPLRLYQPGPARGMDSTGRQDGEAHATGIAPSAKGERSIGLRHPRIIPKGWIATPRLRRDEMDRRPPWPEHGQ